MELRGPRPGYLSAIILDHLAEDLAHLSPKISADQRQVVLDVAVTSDGPDAASRYAQDRVLTTLVGAGLVEWDATVVDVAVDQADDGPERE